jgi:hypothetical protein
MKHTLKTFALPLAFALVGGIAALAGAQSLGLTGKTVVIEKQANAQAMQTANTMPAGGAAIPTDFVEAAERWRQ